MKLITRLGLIASLKFSRTLCTFSWLDGQIFWYEILRRRHWPSVNLSLLVTSVCTFETVNWLAVFQISHRAVYIHTYGRLRPRIFLTFGTIRVVSRQPYAPAAFTPGEIPGTHFQRLSRPQGTWFRREPRKKPQWHHRESIPGPPY